jgi:pentapeptide MXKDX repeat protein
VAAFGVFGGGFAISEKIGTDFLVHHCRGKHNQPEATMKKIILATAVTALMTGAAFAQANPNAPQPSSTGAGINQPGTTSTGVAVDRSDSGKMGTTTGMKKDSMKKDGMAKDGMAKDGMHKDGMAKDGMAKGSMSK